MQLCTTSLKHHEGNWRRRLQGLGGNSQPFYLALACGRSASSLSNVYPAPRLRLRGHPFDCATGAYTRLRALSSAHCISSRRLTPVRRHIRLFLILFSLSFFSYAFADEKSEVAPLAEAAAQASAKIEAKSKWTNFLPYAPEKNEYRAEVGGMWEANNLYWLGFSYGRHMGNCVFSESQKCQQFLDFTGGMGGREAYSEGLLLAGVRWQYVSFPNPYSPSFGLFGGMMNIRDNSRDRQVGVYGMSLGYTMSVHEKFNVTWQTRLGGGDQLWVQSMLTFSMKLDSYVDAFSDRMKKIGQVTLETTGSVLSAPKTFVDWLSSPKKSADSPNPPKVPSPGE